MGAYEDKLDSILSQGDWDAPSFAPVREAFTVLADTLGALAKHDAAQGEAGNAASDSFKALRERFDELQTSVTRMEKVVEDANGDLSAARGGALPSAEVPSWVDNAIDTVDATGKVFIPAMGVSVAANMAKSVFEGFLGNQREEEAKKQYEALSKNLNERGLEIRKAADLSFDNDSNDDDDDTPGGNNPGGNDDDSSTPPGNRPGPSRPGYPDGGRTGGFELNPDRGTPTWENDPNDNVRPPKTELPPLPTVYPEVPTPVTEYPEPPQYTWPDDDSDYSVDSNDPGVIPGGGTGYGNGSSSGNGFGTGTNSGLSAGMLGGGAAAGAGALRYGFGGGAGGPGGIGGLGAGGGIGAGGLGGNAGAASGPRPTGGLLGSGSGGSSGGAAGGGAGAGTGGSGAGAAGARGGMMGGGMGGQGGAKQNKEKRPGLGGHIAPKFEDDGEATLRSKSAAAGGRANDAVDDGSDSSE